MRPVDLLSLPARFLARPAAAALGVEGRTPQERADNLRAEMNLPAADELGLGERHLARFALWGVTLPVVFLFAVLVDVLLSLGGLGESIIVQIPWGVAFFTLWMWCLHGLKAMLAYYVIGRWWNPRSQLWRTAMLNQVPDAVIAVGLTVTLQIMNG